MSESLHSDPPTAESVFAGPGETRALLRATDWAATQLGPVENWPPELLAAIRTVLASRLPVLLFWGPELIQIYNDACLPNLADKHPRSIAQPAAECWREAWEALAPSIDAIVQGRESGVRFDRRFLFLQRHGYLEETYSTFSYSAITDPTGAVVGIFVQANDSVTAEVLADRRLRTLSELGSVSTAGAGSAADACRIILDVLARNRSDIPFGSLYLLDAGHEPRLVAGFGFRDGAPLPPHEGTDPIAMARVRRAATGHDPFLVTGLLEQFPGFYDPAGALDGAEPDSAMMLPLTEHGRSRRLGVLVLGISPHRRFDADYAAFFRLVADQVSIAVTDALAYESERDRARALSDLDAAKTRFFQNISHELRTPLTLLLGPLQHVLDDPELTLPADYRQDLQAAQRAARRLQRLVDGLLEVARGEADRLDPATEPTDLAALTVDCASMFRSAVESAGLRLLVRIPDEHRQVPVDRHMWAHIVLNLLSNAVKFTLTGSITVRLEIADDLATLHVLDTGVGIAAEEIPLIFDRFHQVSGEPARSRQGAGIGLSLVADLVHAHGGTVQVASTPGAGTAFTATIPAASANHDSPRQLEAPTDVAAMFLADAAQWQPAPAAPATTSPRAHHGSVLVVDDNADMRDYLTRLLTRDGWSVTPVGTVTEALNQQGAPDLVLADVMLPERDGLDLLRMLRAGPDSSQVPVVLLTARAGPESIAEGLALGANDYVVKPFEPVELLARVRATAELHRRRQSTLRKALERVSNLEVAVTTNRHIGTAVGILMAEDKINSEQAFEQLSAVSQALHRKLRDVADEVVRTGSLPAP